MSHDDRDGLMKPQSERRGLGVIGMPAPVREIRHREFCRDGLLESFIGPRSAKGQDSFVALLPSGVPQGGSIRLSESGRDGARAGLDSRGEQGARPPRSRSSGGERSSGGRSSGGRSRSGGGSSRGGRSSSRERQPIHDPEMDDTPQVTAHERIEDDGGESSPSGFDDLGLSRASLRAVQAVGYETPSPIQASFIPIAVTGRDCIGQARTGTGKTAAFVLPALERIDSDSLETQVLALTPTRELSEQVAEEARRLSRTRPVFVATCVGGKKINQQIAALQKGAQIVVGTPGRVIDLLSRRLLKLDALKLVILDEADRMLDIGFRPDIEKILRQCPTDRQTLLLSATMPPPVERLAQRYMRDPDRVNLSNDQVVVHTVDQYYVTVDPRRKLEALVKLLYHVRPRQAIVFCRTKRGADKLHSRLSSRLSAVAAIHGDLAQSARDRAMKQFREGRVRLLIATDVVGRGIDVSGVSHIVNYDVPEFCDDYVHRVGRTGRLSSGDIGMAFTFVAREEGDQLTSIEKRINKLLDGYSIPGYDVADVVTRTPAPIRPDPVDAMSESPSDPVQVSPAVMASAAEPDEGFGDGIL